MRRTVLRNTDILHIAQQGFYNWIELPSLQQMNMDFDSRFGRLFFTMARVSGLFLKPQCSYITQVHQTILMTSYAKVRFPGFSNFLSLNSISPSFRRNLLICRLIPTN